MLGLDYASRHTEEQLQDAIAQGIRFVIRYLAPPYLEVKTLSIEERDTLISLGLGIVSVYQRRNTQLSDFDREHAKLDAEWAYDNAEKVGQFRGPIYFAVDYDVPVEHLPILQEYLDEITKQLQPIGYDVGVYGSYRVIEELKARYKWQTYAWSGGKVSYKANFIQCHNGAGVAGGSNDINVAWEDPGFCIAPTLTEAAILPTIRTGSRGWFVSVAQSLLTRSEYPTKGIDGIFGSDTEKAVLAYQSKKELIADGIIGKDTWKYLFPDVRLLRSNALNPEIAHLHKEIENLREKLLHIKSIVQDVY